MNENKNLEELLEEPVEWFKWIVPYTWFCTIFLRKKNKAMFTFDTLEWFTEEHWKAVALMKWAMWNLPKDVFACLREFVNQTWDLDDGAKVFMSEFDKRFRVLVSNR